jgi:HD-GYP domain-containing protein (c-di-GMP phosphodiesterase class II)
MHLQAGAGMSTDCALLLISDRVDGGRELAGRINSLHRCWAIGLYNDAKSAVPSASAIVIDVALMDGLAIGRLQYLLSLYRRPTAEAVAILRTGTRRERVQAAALGATIIFAADVSVPELVASLVPTIRPAAATAVSARRLNGTPSIAKTRLQFEALFVGAAQGEPVIKSLVEEATETVLAALAESSIRQWLEVVWTYDDATYQHCLLVTGVAAAFAIDLKFSESDQRQLTQGALLHDVGKV